MSVQTGLTPTRTKLWSKVGIQGNSESKRSASVAQQAAEVSSSMISEMESMRESTEQAALSIGHLLERIVNIATQGNAQVQSALSDAVGRSDDSEDSINDVVIQQVNEVNSFIEHVRTFLSEQVQMAMQAHAACQTISKSATNVAELTKTSQILSINLRIEASRLGESGNSFKVLGEEVHSFSASVMEAAKEINGSVGEFLQTIPRIREQAVEMESGVSELSERFHSKMDVLSERTRRMDDSLRTTLDEVETQNNQILDCSNETLGHLAFQDPVSQGLQRMQHNVSEMQSVIDGEKPDFVSLSEIRQDVGEDGRSEREAGEVDLF
jgi:methyl-accepting chemotaxis protein